MHPLSTPPEPSVSRRDGCTVYFVPCVRAFGTPTLVFPIIRRDAARSTLTAACLLPRNRKGGPSSAAMLLFWSPSPGPGLRASSRNGSGSVQTNSSDRRCELEWSPGASVELAGVEFAPDQQTRAVIAPLALRNPVNRHRFSSLQRSRPVWCQASVATHRAWPVMAGKLLTSAPDRQLRTVSRAPIERAMTP